MQSNKGRGRANRGGRARGEPSQESNRPGPNAGHPRGPPGQQRGPPGGSQRGGPPPQGAWSRPQDRYHQPSQSQQATGTRQQDRSQPSQSQATGARPQDRYQPAPQPPQGAWAKQSQQSQSAQSESAQSQQTGRGIRGAGEDPSVSKLTQDEPQAVTGSGDAGDSQSKRGGNGGVRGRLNRYEIIHTKPANLQTKQGTSGQPISLTANFFKVVNTPNWCLHQYRVDFSPEVDDTRVKRKLVQIAYKHENDIGGFLFDGSMMFTPLRFPQPLKRYAKLNDLNIEITVKYSTELLWGDYHYLQVFNILVRKCLSMLQLQLVGRNYFDPKASVNIPDHRLCLWPGYYTSIRQHEKDIMMNAEITFKVMRTDNVYDLLLECPDKISFKKKIVGTVVLTYYNNKTYRIDDVSDKLSPKSTFTLKSGEQITYEKYFQDKYKLKIHVPTQPILISRLSKREIAAGAQEEIHLIPEFCQMTGLSDEQRSNFHLMSAVAQHTRVPPAGRMDKLRDFVKRLTANKDIVNEVKRWDLNIATSLIQFNGRTLNNEGIRVGESQMIPSGPKADWTNGLRNTKLLIAAKMERLVVITKSDDLRRTEDFMKALIQVARGMKWNLGNYEIETVDGDRSSDYLRCLDRVLPTRPSLVLVFVRNKSADRYNAIKKKCCVDRGIPSQVVLTKHFNGRGTLSVATKIAIQMNCKIGGSPWAVSIPLKGLMVVGYDVCRDTARKGNCFSGMVASLDASCTRYFSAVAEHQFDQELSDNFASFMVLAMAKYHEINQCYPSRICIYRDGVGDGQITHVREHEVMRIKERLEPFYPDPANSLKLAFIVVSKRINTRIFHQDKNPPPGTVVDNTITLPERYDFFIVSQCVNQGTVSPTSYNVIYDTISLPPDHLQILAYKMCHMYFNWSGTVRVPAPCQYAHKLAFLTAQSLHRPAHRNLDTVLYFL
ncbi:hypothetical protein WA026_017610 [Henosepilachna vigintioctopunctata]|uniref:Piwi n=1 Tax=Henosepilachna vigintioctopunctata TaxID=420089 RepID=A0AAW1UT33_9CUCU